MSSQLIEAITLAYDAHLDQVDKAGQPFIGHPLRVMAMLNTEDEMVVGVLHDIIEDTDMQLTEPQFGFLSVHQKRAIDAISRRPGEMYRDYIARCGQNELATAVKRADILDNADPRRRWAGAPLSRYRWAWQYLWTEEPLPGCLQ